MHISILVERPCRNIAIAIKDMSIGLLSALKVRRAISEEGAHDALGEITVYAI